MHSVTKIMGHGSSKQNFVGDLMITFRTSSSETDSKKLNLGKSEGSRKTEGVSVRERISDLT